MRSGLRTLAAALFLCVACDDDITGTTVYVAQEPFTITLAASGVSHLELTGISGNTVVTGISTVDSVRIVGVRQVGSRESQEDATARLDALQVQSGVQGNAIVVNTVQPTDQEGREYTVHYELTLPKTLQLHLVTANGDIRAVSMTSTVDLDIANGTATLENHVGNVTADVANGKILCTARLPLNGTFDLSVANGEIFLTIPTNTSAWFDATVGNGGIQVLALDLQDLVSTNTRVTGRLGSGQGTIDLIVGNGTISASGVAP
jgi:hypothetical protein